MMPVLSADEKKWRAEEDARTLARAKEIKSDKARFKAALKAAERMFKDTMKEANNMKAVSKLGIGSRPMMRKR